MLYTTHSHKHLKAIDTSTINYNFVADLRGHGGEGGGGGGGGGGRGKCKYVLDEQLIT